VGVRRARLDERESAERTTFAGIQEGSAMYARRISRDLKPNTAKNFTNQLEKEVIPILRKQKGFQDEMEFLAPDGNKVFTISLWDRKESADAYAREAFPKVEKILAPFVEGVSRVETYEVPCSTCHKIGPAVIV
jgi:heme-degrading monooxygenase HmoA